MVFHSMNSSLRRSRADGAAWQKGAGRVLLFPLLAMLAAPLFADADLKVRVFERGGTQPLAGVSVCLGTPARVSQFGSSMTDADGNVRFTAIPRAPLVVTVSRPGYKGEQQSLVTTNTVRTLVMSLSAGGGGPQCMHEGEAEDAFSGGLHIGYFSLISQGGDSANRQVVLSHSVNREPTHYRVSENRDFSGAAWQPYLPGPVYRLSQGAGYKVVYFQVRRHSQMNGSDVEMRSPVMQDVILVQ
jgi:hypothetical protein